MPHNDFQSESTSPPLLVSSLALRKGSQSQKGIETVIFKPGDATREIRLADPPGGPYQEQFDPPLEVPLHTKIALSVRYRGGFFGGGGIVPFLLDPKDLLSEDDGQDGKQVYRKTDTKIEITIGFQFPPPTVHEIMASCSKFRVLIIGESGVGKSTLINKMFGVSSVHVSGTTRGRASIELEHTAAENSRFIVHDTCGFEAADHDNLKTVRDFISRRKRMPCLKDRVHAVWLCLAIPHANSRVMEAGVEEFLRERQEILGDIPLVVVFTKLGLLVNKLKAEALEDGENLDDAAINERKRESLEKLCFAPVRNAVGGGNVSHVAVSSIEDYQDSRVELMEETMRNIKFYLKNEAVYYLAAIAQRVSISFKVASTIAIGEKRYWKSLKASPNFQGRTMKECLNVLHKDIVTIWNFDDQEDILQKNEIKGYLLSIPGSEGSQSVGEATKPSSALNAKLMAIITPALGAGYTALPAAGVACLGILALHLYDGAQDVVRQLMKYIVDLTCIMQIVFLLIAVLPSKVVTPDIVRMAMKAYEETYRHDVHVDIDDFSVHLAIAPGKCDTVLEKIKELIFKYRVSDEQISELRRQLQ